MGSRVLLVIDMLNDFLDREGALYCGDRSREIIPVIQSLVHRFREEHHPVIFLRDAHRPDDLEFGRFPVHAVKGTWGSEIIPELQPPPGSLVVDKTRFSGFHRTNLAEMLDDIGPEEVWVTGVVTSICVMDTAGGLVDRDYPVVIPVNAVADFDPESERFALQRMERVYKVRLIHHELAAAA